MKRVDLIRYLEKHGCVFHREGSNHTVYRRVGTVDVSVIPRHREVKEVIVRKICKQLGVPNPLR